MKVKLTSVTGSPYSEYQLVQSLEYRATNPTLLKVTADCN